MKGAKRARPRHIEAEHQRALFRWASLAQARIPELRWLFHVPNGEKRDRRTAELLKAAGVKAGVPDIVLPVPSEFHGLPRVGLVVELKAPGGDKPSPTQQEWLMFLSRVGWAATTCYGWQSARLTICEYLGVRP